jgi:PleD family two-component response regulator
MRILVVDDSEDSRDITEGALLSAGYEDIAMSASGWEALKFLDVGGAAQREALVDLVLLDVMMPEMDGVEVCARIRNDPRYADLPIIMVTALSDMDSLANAFVAGATDYVTKPVNRIELVARVRAALRLKAELDRRLARERELLGFLSSWGDRRGQIWVDDATGLLSGEVGEAYLIGSRSVVAETVSVIALMLDGADARRSDAAAGQAAASTQVAHAVRRLAANVGVVAAAYKNGTIVLIAPEFGADQARELAQRLHAVVQKLRLPSPDSITSDYVTASVAVVAGRARRDSDRIKVLTQALASVQQAAAAGGNRVVVQLADGAAGSAGQHIAEQLGGRREVGMRA